MTVKFKGVVVREKEQGEMDKTVQILTDTMGMVFVRARGVRKISSSNSRSVQLFAYSEFVVSEKNGFYTLQESTLITNFYGIREDVVSYALACYLCELSSYVNIGGEEGMEIQRFLLNALYATEKKIAHPLLIKAAYEFRLAAMIGYEPDLTECPLCGTPAADMQNRIFNLTDGYLCCAECEPEKDEYTRTVPLSEPVFRALRLILSAPVNKVFLFRLEQPYLQEIADVAETYMLLRLEHKLQTLSFFKQTISLP